MKTRLRKAECTTCGYIIRVTRFWIGHGLPTCVCGTPMVCLEPGDAATPLRVIHSREAPRKLRATGFVYFIRAGDDGPVKIGYAADPMQRLAELQTGSPYGLVLLAAVPGDQRLEAALHRRYSHLHVRGEWYESTDELLNGVPQLDVTPSESSLFGRDIA